MVDKVVNAVIAEYILSIIAPSDGNTKDGVANGGGHVTPLNPTCEILINILVGERFTDLSEDRTYLWRGEIRRRDCQKNGMFR